MNPTWWKPETEQKLRELKGSGLTAAQAGALINMSRTAIIGKCRRLGIQLQDKPQLVELTDDIVKHILQLRSEGLSLRRIQMVVKVSTHIIGRVCKGTHLSCKKVKNPNAPKVPIAKPAQAKKPVILAPTPKIPDVIPFPAHRVTSVRCCWPIGDPQEKGFRFCEDKAIFGKPYCGEHLKIAYRRDVA